MIRPPPNGTPAQSDRTSTPQICTIASASRGRSIGIGPMGATAGAAVVGRCSGWCRRRRTAADRGHGAAARCRELRLVALETLQRFGAAGLHARAMGHEIGPARGADGGRLLRRRFRRRAAAARPGRRARQGRVGRWRAPAPPVLALAGFLAGAACRAGSAGAAAAGGGAAGSDCTAAWQLGERSAVLAFRHCRISGLFGAIQEQCDTKSLSVQACCTVLSCSFWVSAGATSIPGGARSTLAAGGAVSDCAGAAGAGAAGAAAAAGSAGFGAAAFTAAWQDGESLASLRTRHSNASLPPGWTPEQLAMKSERQAARMASR